MIRHRQCSLVGLLFGFALHVSAQEWYCKNPTFQNSYHYYDGAGFALNGKLYFGLGFDPAVVGVGQFSGTMLEYDPATNEAHLKFSLPSGTQWQNSIAFSIGSYGYVGLGGDGMTIFRDEIDGYDPVSGQTWTIPSFPGGGRYGAVAFTINNTAYVGGGFDLDVNNGSPGNSKDLWAYDPAANSWTARANMPAVINDGIAFSIGTKGYVIPSSGGALWEYDPTTNTWTARASFPGGARNGAYAFSVNGLGYVGCGVSGGVPTQDMYAYDPVSNSWSAAPSLWAATARHHGVGLSVGNTGYIIGGIAGNNAVFQDIWMLGPATTPASNTWTQRPFVPGGSVTTFGFSIGDKGYAGGGSAFQRYDPATRTWSARAPPPPNTNGGFSIDGKGYATTSAATQNFWEYDPLQNVWTMKSDLPGGARDRAAIFTLEGKGYVCGGWINNARMNDLWAYDPATNSWTQRANRIGSAALRASGFSIGNKGYTAGGDIGGSTNAVCRYDPVLDSWAVAAGLPSLARQGGQAFVVGNKVWYGGGYHNGPIFSKRCDVYDPVTNTWAQVADLGGNYRYDGVSFSIGDKGYILGGKQDPTTGTAFVSDFYDSSEMWEYNPETVSISPRATLEGPFDQSSGLMNDGLRAASLLPRADPYGSNGYPYPGGEYSDRPFTIPSTTGNNAIVDRVIVELRNATTPFAPIASRSVWLQRDGDIVDLDGTSPVRFTVPPGPYEVAVRHRNHLGAMTLNPVALSGTPVTVDLSAPTTQTYGTNARKTIGSKAVLWAGDITFDKVIKYTGANNDRDPILLTVGGSTPNATVSGQYRREDVNLDGSVKYAGANNDRDPILVNVGNTTPNNVRTEQVP